MKQRKYILAKLLTLAWLLMLIAGCQEMSSVDLKRESSPTIARPTTTGTIKKEKTVGDLAREYGQQMSKPACMDYFFDTIFSANFREARNITSVRYRKGRTHKEIEDEWQRFYEAASKHGLNRKNLSYRTDPYGENNDFGVVISPSGRVIMAVFFAKTQHPFDKGWGWQVDDVRFFYKTLEIQSSKGLERIVLTDKPNHPTHKAIREILAERYPDLEELHHNSNLVKELVLSDGWARVVVHVDTADGLWQVLLRNQDDRWIIVTVGMDIDNFDYPDSPYKLWVSENQK